MENGGDQFGLRVFQFINQLALKGDAMITCYLNIKAKNCESETKS